MPMIGKMLCSSTTEFMPIRSCTFIIPPMTFDVEKIWFIPGHLNATSWSSVHNSWLEISTSNTCFGMHALLGCITPMSSTLEKGTTTIKHVEWTSFGSGGIISKRMHLIGGLNSSWISFTSHHWFTQTHLASLTLMLCSTVPRLFLTCVEGKFIAMGKGFHLVLKMVPIGIFMS